MVRIILIFVVLDAAIFASSVIAESLNRGSAVASVLMLLWLIFTAVGSFLIGTGLMFSGTKSFWKELNK